MSQSRRRFIQIAGRTGAGLALMKPGCALAAVANESKDELQARLASDPLRPQFHLLPARGWMNDPNGPIYWKGCYHMFFQYNPRAAVWGDMHWAHAVSPDMIHWRHLPVALAPTPGSDDADGCFSGSAVDNRGTATVLYTGVKTVPPERATLRDGTHNFREVQCLATSEDEELRSWRKLPSPVLEPPVNMNVTGFRDPFLWRSGESWYMGVGSGISGEGGRVLLYRSKDLRVWEYVHPLACGEKNERQTSDPVDSGEMWECPDFFELQKKHILLYSTERKVYWETGDFDEKELMFHPQKRGVLDHGAFYAPKSQTDALGRRILWGWIPETRPESEYSAAGWAGCMSLPRVLSLDANGSLQMTVVPEIEKLRVAEAAVPNRESGRRQVPRITEWNRPPLEIEVQFRGKPFGLRVAYAERNALSLQFDPGRAGGELRAGERSVPIANPRGARQLRIFLDGSVVECFVDQTLAWTWRTYVRPGGLRVETEDVESAQIWALKAISADRLTTQQTSFSADRLRAQIS